MNCAFGGTATDTPLSFLLFLLPLSDNDITDVLEETFSVTEDRFGQHVIVELRPGGADQAVTEVNKEEYVELVVSHRIAGRISEQFRAFMEGLGDVLPLDLLRVFDEHELELLIGGMTEIDMDDWTRFTDYRGYEKTDRVIEWFWTCLRSWPTERKARLLQFTTGTSRVPVNGFKDLQGSDGPRRFTIEKSGDPSGLPRSHTCFNRLDLPPYEDYESLERKLRFAIECVLLSFFVRGQGPSFTDFTHDACRSCAFFFFCVTGRRKALDKSRRRRRSY
jgi:E3 ubiquitin-protein ligase NEDD4